jgi:hypothetical protein
MRALLGFSVLVAVGLAGCGSSPPAAPSVKPVKQVQAAVPTGPTCDTDQLSARLGPRTELGRGQGSLPLIFTNTSRQPCVLRGAPAVVLRGPADPNGPDYALFHPIETGRGLMLAPGTSGVARLVVQSDADGTVGSHGSNNWVPTRLEAVPPGHGEQTALSVPWPTGVTVLRQDGVSHPDSWIEGVKADPAVTS